MNPINDLLTPSFLFPNKPKPKFLGANAATPGPLGGIDDGGTTPPAVNALGAAPSPYNSDSLLEKSIDLYGGLEYLTLVLFSVVQHYDTLLKKISVDLNSSRRDYNSLLTASEHLTSCIRKLREVSANAGSDQTLQNPKTCVELKTLAAGTATATYKYPATGKPCITPTGKKGDCILSNEDLEGLAETIKILDPATTIVLLDLQTNGEKALSLSKIKEINDDAQQRLVYMNAVSVQKGGLIQAAETNYQIVVQFSAGIIAVIKTVGSAIAQRI